MSKPVNVVVVGPSEAGKTLLLRHLKRLATNRKDDNDYVSSSIDPISCKTVPTTGCENCKFQWAGQAVVMREVGSCLQLRWNKWTRRQHSGTSRSPAAASKVIFVVDASDMVQGTIHNAINTELTSEHCLTAKLQYDKLEQHTVTYHSLDQSITDATAAMLVLDESSHIA